MHQIGLIKVNQDQPIPSNLDQSNVLRSKNSNHYSHHQQNNKNQQQQPQLGYINYQQPHSGRKQSLGQGQGYGNQQGNHLSGSSFIGLAGSNQPSMIQNNSLNLSSVIRNGNLQQTKDTVHPFLNKINPQQNAQLKQSSSLPHLFSQNNQLSLSGLGGQAVALGQNNSQLYNQNSGSMNRSTQQIRMNRSKLNPSSSFASATNGGVGSQGRKSFYHHSNIFNLKHYKHLTEHVIDGTDIDEIKNHQRSLLIREFRYKVEQYLLFSKYRKEQATREFNSYYNKIQDQLFRTEGSDLIKMHSKGQGSAAPNAGVSFFSMNNDDQNQSLSIIQPELNKSLLNIDANRFNYSKLSKQEASLINNMSIDIYLEDQFGRQRQATHKLNNKKLQDYIINKIKPFLSNDTEYDTKIEFYTKEYERILEKIQKQQFIFLNSIWDILYKRKQIFNVILYDSKIIQCI